MNSTTHRNIGGSILPSSSPHILEPVPFRHGVLVVRPIPQLDSHGLFWERDGLSSCLAEHSNGHSCHALGKRMVAGDVSRTREQAEYILRCGGMCKQIEHLAELLSIP